MGRWWKEADANTQEAPIPKPTSTIPNPTIPIPKPPQTPSRSNRGQKSRSGRFPPLCPPLNQLNPTTSGLYFKDPNRSWVGKTSPFCMHASIFPDLCLRRFEMGVDRLRLRSCITSLCRERSNGYLYVLMHR